MKLSQQRIRAAKRDAAIRAMADVHPEWTCDQLGNWFHCSRETARKALRVGSEPYENNKTNNQVPPLS